MPRSSVPSRLAPTATSSRSNSAQPTAQRSPNTLPAVQPLPPSPLIQKLRQDYRWAAISQFLWTFGDGLGLTSTNWDVDALEQDLDSPEEDRLVPDILVKLLYALTYDRTVTRQTLESHLRKQYLLRSPRTNPFGSLRTHPHDPRPWAELGLGDKVAALHDLCEWQLAEPAKFRALLKNEGEMDGVAWRIEPCGWDKDENTYWLFDDNRLWVQHPPPPEPKPPKPLKASVKRAAASKSKGKGKGRPSTTTPVDTTIPKKSHKRKERPHPEPSSPEFDPAADEDMDRETARAILNDYLGLRSSGRRSTRTQDAALMARAKAALDPTAPVGRRTRTQTHLGPPTPLTGSAAGAASSSRTRSRAQEEVETPSKRPRAGAGTRGSYRLRGAGEQEEEVWQEIPEEWLSPDKVKDNAAGSSKKGSALAKSKNRSGGGKGKPMSDDSDSDLSELSDTESREEKRPADAEEPLSTGEVKEQPIAKVAQVNIEQAEEEVTPMDVDEAAQVPDAGLSKAEEVDPVLEEKDVVMPADEVLKDAQIPGGKGEQEEKPKTEATEGEGDNGVKAEAGPATPLEEAKIEVPAAAEDHELDTAPKEAASDEPTKIEEPEEDEYPEEEIDANDYVRLESRKARNRNYVEWEAVCVNRWDWENFPLKFKGSKHVDEKAFYAHLMENLCPGIIVALREKEIEVAKQEAIRNRKRSSRILMRELEREEQQAADDARREMEVRMQRVRDEERRKAAEEEGKAAKERERDERLREREERIKQREEAIYEKAVAEAKAKEKLEQDRQRRAARREAGITNVDSDDEQGAQAGTAVKSKKRKADALEEAEEDDWELACEICHQSGWNIDDGKAIVACETCGRWQHQACHDTRDDSQGRARRDWNNVDFFCAECRRRKAREREKPDVRENAKGLSSPVQSPISAKSPSLKFKIPRAAPEAGASALKEEHGSAVHVHQEPRRQTLPDRPLPMAYAAHPGSTVAPSPAPFASLPAGARVQINTQPRNTAPPVNFSATAVPPGFQQRPNGAATAQHPTYAGIPVSSSRINPPVANNGQMGSPVYVNGRVVAYGGQGQRMPTSTHAGPNSPIVSHRPMGSGQPSNQAAPFRNGHIPNGHHAGEQPPIPSIMLPTSSYAPNALPGANGPAPTDSQMQYRAMFASSFPSTSAPPANAMYSANSQPGPTPSNAGGHPAQSHWSYGH